MLSHLRFHRRGSSNPTSPLPDVRELSLPPPQHGGAPGAPDVSPASPNKSSLPPTLPPIPRVTSTGSNFELPDFSSPASLPNQPPQQPRGKDPEGLQRQREQQVRDAPRPSPYDTDSGFIGGVALQNYRRVASHQDLPRISNPESQLRSPHQQSTLSPPGTSASSQSNPLSSRLSPSFVTPTDLRNSATSPGTRIPPPSIRHAPESYSQSVAMPPADPPKGKKGLPFLKNPMSTLLMRRKANQSVVPDLRPLPLQTTAEPSYDPRIRGTRVHDFSAPRPRKPAPPAVREPPSAPKPREPEAPPIPDKSRLRQTPAEGAENQPPAVDPGAGTAPAQPEKLDVKKIDAPSISSGPSFKGSLTDKPLPPQASPPVVPPKDEAPTASTRTPSSTSKTPLSSMKARSLSRLTASTRTNRSGAASFDPSETLSSIPQHMKSTSSRFSFDMIGAAKQEKLLEERHRQRQLERQTTRTPSLADRDSRFDDLDDFDYDAMMDDDGLEEAIPGVNADYEEEPIPGLEDEDFEEPIPGVNIDLDYDDYDGQGGFDDGEDDPDNDQENFAGFVFQRSNPHSAVTSPHSAGLLATPRDAEGKAIGFAIAETPGLTLQEPSPLSAAMPAPLDPKRVDELAGLGIQNLQVPDDVPVVDNREDTLETRPTNGAAPHSTESTKDDDLYFDEGMDALNAEFADELDFGPAGEGEPFDEALFDLDDTDQYGRPIPGAFQAARAAYAAREQAKRESDVTSGGAQDQSAVSQSTTRTSLSAPPAPALPQEPELESEFEQQHPVSKPPSEVSPTLTYAIPPGSLPVQEEDKMAAYQAALAAAALQAEAAGKFVRESPPGSPHPTSHHADDDDSNSLNGYDAYDDHDYDEPSGIDLDDYGNDMDGLELDYSDIIAEANASALANDADGWYGREFGFYSAPATQQHGTPLPFEYANGGYFGPAGGLGRTVSGRMVSREPNLTPITERSEYSNRNSIMSLAVPPIGSGGAAGAAAGSGVQSPGLAQLAMMADAGDDGNMTLSALMRLRNKAWGGSQASLASSKDGSPRSERGGGGGGDLASPFGSFGLTGVGGGVGPGGCGPMHVRMGSSFSVLSRESEGYGSLPGSPTLHVAVPSMVGSPPGPGFQQPPGGLGNGSNGGIYSSPEQVQNGTPLPWDAENARNGSDVAYSASQPGNSYSAAGDQYQLAGHDGPTTSRRTGLGHRHKGSAGSISYVKEEDSGETRWVLERRRLDESGEVEILEREVLTDGRI